VRSWKYAAAFVLLSDLLAAGALAGTTGTWTTHLYMNDVRRIAVAPDGVWCATRGGALFFDFATSEFASWNRSRDGLASDSLVDVDILANGQVAFATAGAGVSAYQPATGVWFAYTSLTWPIAGDAVRFIHEDPPWRIIGSLGGVLVQENGQTRVTCQYQVDPCGLPSWDVTAGVRFQGHFWFGTASGETGSGAIGRLNYNLGSWDTVTTPGDVVDLAVWQETLWCVTTSGVYVWNGSGWDDRNAGLSGIAAAVRQLHAGAQRLLAAAWGTDGGPFYWDASGGRWERLAGAHLRGCCTVAEGADGIVWVGASAGWSESVPYLGADEDGLWELVGQTWVQHRHDGPHPVADYRGLTLDDAGRLWAASAGSYPLGWRIMNFDDGHWTFYNNQNAPLSRGWGWHIRVLGQRLWLGHCCCTGPEGACFLDDWIIGSAEAAVHDSVFNVVASTIDAHGNLWFSSNRENPEEYPEAVKGLFHYDLAADVWRHYDMESTGGRLLSNAVTSVAVQGDTLWVGYASQGVHRVLLDPAGLPILGDAGAWKAYSTADGLAGERIADIETRPGEVWIATDNGVSLRDGLVWRTFRSSTGQLPSGVLNDLALTDDGAAWVAISGVGVTRISRSATGGWSVFETFGPPDLVSSYTRYVVRGSTGRDIWVATSRGLSHFVPSPERAGAGPSRLDVYPNPFNPDCDGAVTFVDLPGRTREGLVVDLSGRIVRRFAQVWADEPFWDGRDLAGQRVAPGVYIVRASTPQGWLTGRIAVLDLPCE
jgi:hypothetical protein